MHETVQAVRLTGANLGQPLALPMLNAEAMAQISAQAGRRTREASLADHLKKVNAALDPHARLQCLVVTQAP